jgi:hypothetical protein
MSSATIAELVSKLSRRLCSKILVLTEDCSSHERLSHSGNVLHVLHVVRIGNLGLLHIFSNVIMAEPSRTTGLTTLKSITKAQITAISSHGSRV